jgi:hypothetical protein
MLSEERHNIRTDLRNTDFSVQPFHTAVAYSRFIQLQQSAVSYSCSIQPFHTAGAQSRLI